MEIKQLILGDYWTNCYIVRGPEPGRCIVIDPADNAPVVLHALDELGTVPEAVLLTHGHYDHILAIPGLQARWPSLPVYCQSLDWPKELEEKDMGQVYPTVSAFPNLRPYPECGVLRAAGLELTILATPGHTPGSVTLLCGDALFTGDTLFQRDMGRTDLPGGSEAEIMASLARLAALPGDYRVLPGHDAVSTLSAEREGNPYLRAALRAASRQEGR